MNQQIKQFIRPIIIAIFRVINRFKKLSLPKKTLIIGMIIILVAIIGFVTKKLIKPAPKSLYEIAVMVRDQSAPDPVEDARSSLKAGDVIVVQPDGHAWSTTERTSYLILRMNLTAEQAAKILQPKERKIDDSEIPAEEKARLDAMEDDEQRKRMKEEMENRKEIVIARQYHIDMTEFPGFDPLQLLNAQPYLDKAYDWSIVDKK